MTAAPDPALVAEVRAAAARLSDGLERAKALGGDVGTLAGGLLGVVSAVNAWIGQSAEGDPLNELGFTRAQAAEEILNALEAGLGGAR